MIRIIMYSICILLFWGCEDELPPNSEFDNNIVAAKSFGSGKGTQSNPYLIFNINHLKKLVDDVNNGNSYANTYFRLTTDIQVTADEWILIGVKINGPTFNGNFDGGDHIISGILKSDRHKTFGFFGAIDGDARITNLTIAATVQSEGTYTGAIAGESWSANINNCRITGTVKGGDSTGGILGISYHTTIRNCDVCNTITGEGNAGGIVGTFYGEEIHTSLNTGDIFGYPGHTGGLVGRQYVDSHIYSCCTNRGRVNGEEAKANNQTGNGNTIETCPDRHTKR